MKRRTRRNGAENPTQVLPWVFSLSLSIVDAQKLRYRKIIVCSDQRIVLICANSYSSAAFEADALVLYKCSYMKLGKKLIPYG
jgi:hypothetical protein